MVRILTDTIVSRGAEHVEADMAGQTVMMSIPRGRYFALEGTGQRIWSLIAEPRRVGEIVDILMDEYDVDREACRQEVEGFVSELVTNGLAVARVPV